MHTVRVVDTISTTYDPIYSQRIQGNSAENSKRADSTNIPMNTLRCKRTVRVDWVYEILCKVALDVRRKGRGGETVNAANRRDK